jgi:sugar phosphate isomerase/epimerase
VAPRLSISQITTFRSTFAEDVRAYAAAGLDGIGVWELKLAEGGDAEALELLEESGLARASAVPTVPSILPLPLLGGPEDPQERIDAYCRSLERLAPFRPAGVVCLTGTGDRDTAVEGLRTIAAEAERLGLTIALEPYQREGGELWSVVHSIPEAVELIEDAGDPPSVGIQFDVWHLWNTPTLFDDIANEVHRFAGVHVCDWREPTRGWADRALPGHGGADVPAILRALDSAGWDGLYDIEIFSDDGTFGAPYDDSYWAMPAEETLARARDAFERCWSLTPQEVEETR